MELQDSSGQTAILSWTPMQDAITERRLDSMYKARGPWESRLLWSLENILGSNHGDKGPLVCPVML